MVIESEIELLGVHTLKFYFSRRNVKNGKMFVEPMFVVLFNFLYQEVKLDEPVSCR